MPEQARCYAEAARRAVDAGSDGVDLHGANGYLLSQSYPAYQYAARPDTKDEEEP